MNEQGPSAAEELNRLWDATLNQDLAAVAHGDAELAGAISALQAADDAPDPDHAFLARLRSDLLNVGEPALRHAPAHGQPLGLVWAAPAILRSRSFVRLAIAAIAAVLIIAALSGGGRWLSGSGPAPMVASAMASSVPIYPTAVPTSSKPALEGNGPLTSLRTNSSGLFQSQPTVVPNVTGATLRDDPTARGTDGLAFNWPLTCWGRSRRHSSTECGDG
jgi:hypothetical protein